MSHRQNTGGGSSGRSSPPDGHYSHRNKHVGASNPFVNKNRMSLGRGRQAHGTALGSGLNHFKGKPTSVPEYRPKVPSPDFISNSIDAGGSNMKQSECFEASESFYEDYGLRSSSIQSNSKSIHVDAGASNRFAHDSLRTNDGTSRGRGKYSQYTFSGSGSKHLNEKPASNYGYRPSQLPDVIPKSLKAEGSRMKKTEYIPASNLVCGDSYHSFSAQSAFKNIQLDVMGIKLEEISEKKAEDGTTSKFGCSGKVKVGHFQEFPPPAESKDHASQEKSPKSSSGLRDSGHSVQQAVDKPFDLCPPKRPSVMLNPSLLMTNRQKRNDLKLSMEGQIQTVLRPGMVLLKKYLSLSDQVNIVKVCRNLGLGPGGFYQPGYRDGATLHLKMMCFGKNWDPETSKYGDFRPIDGAKPPSIPAEFYRLVGKAIQDSHSLIEKNYRGRKDCEAEVPSMSPDICIANFYTTTGKLGLHQDKDESQESINTGLPVVSFSVGDSAEFLYGDLRDVYNAQKVILESGDVLIFGGNSRSIFHGVASIMPDTAPKSLLEETNIRQGRLNLTFRQY